LLRSAAKGRRIVIADASDRKVVINWLKAGLPARVEFLKKLAAKAEKIVSEYCLASAQYHSDNEIKGLIAHKTTACLYGENAWQTPAGLFSVKTDDKLTLDKFKLIAGTNPSYNNFCDLERLLQTVTHIAAGFDLNRDQVPYIAVGVKHGNACGAAFGADKIAVVKNMIKGDTRAIYGGAVMLNFSADEKIAEVLLNYLKNSGQHRLLDMVIASEFSPAAIEILKRKGDKCRLMANPALAGLNKNTLDAAPRFRYVRGGFLAQPNYTEILNFKNPNLQKNKMFPRQKPMT
jgi:AICAR transformylase/IMP cyclohydrolase PurH